MKKRVKKAPVDPVKALEWLKRNESGESISKIAQLDDFDDRTVRKHIDKARRAREVTEARLATVRGALEQHYEDICRFAKTLDAEIKAEASISESVRNDRMWEALKQHQPDSSLWRNLKRWDKLQDSLAEIRKSLRDRIQGELRADRSLGSFKNPQRDAMISGLTDALIFQMEQWGRGLAGLSLEENLVSEPVIREGLLLRKRKTGRVNIRYGAFHMGIMYRRYRDTVLDIIRDWGETVKRWQEHNQLSEQLRDLLKAKAKITDELELIVYRRVVPGRCKYCPQ